MTIQQLIECDDDRMISWVLKLFISISKSTNHCLKLFSLKAKTFLQKSPTDGVVAAPSKARFGAYSTAEMKKFVGWALKQPDNWQKWITLLLAYTGARRARLPNWRSHR
jgi:hypothetical protein